MNITVAQAMYDNLDKRIMNTKISLPHTDELKKSLRSAGLGSFASVTKIHEYLGEHKALFPIEIIRIVDGHLDHYNDFKHTHCRNSAWPWLEKEDRQKILQFVFGENKEACQKVLNFDAGQRNMQAKL